MLIQLQKSLIDSIRQYANIEQQQKPTDDTIGMIVGLTIAVILIVCFFIYLAYFLPWWSCYNLICAKCLDFSDCFDCILCYYLCPCMETKAFRYQMQQNKTNGNKVFVQDLLTTPDGCNQFEFILFYFINSTFANKKV